MDFDGLSFDDFLVEMEDFEVRKTRRFDRIWKIGFGGSISSTPIITDEAVYFGAWDWYIYALRKKDGSVRWKFRGDGGFGFGQALENGVIYAGSYNGTFYAIDASSGKELWRFTTSTLQQSELPSPYENFELVVRKPETGEEPESDGRYELSLAVSSGGEYSLKSEYVFKSEYKQESEYK